ncbi:LysR family transcriptional regulator [Pandoraea iniqua]|uniref:LysR family transcriptional regulator n=1 Tax=Pandoraea iniqua TaxID=2508288 RepID=A0A5E4VWJ7_9BURK|nr:LysR family transcriptional regulator [Pandoraea iniqua]VVE15355.1 LysR family transcriptional regulator [Pandoraea iniqua]
MLDIQCLKDFLVLARLKHFGRAAEQCHVSTSGLSRRIQSLEIWLGAPVLIRSANGIELTEVGQRLLPISTDAVLALESVRKAVHAEVANRREQIRFTAPHIMSVLFFSSWFPLLSERFQNTRFSVTSDHLDACIAALDAGEEDFLVFLCDEARGVLGKVGTSLDRTAYTMLTIGTERLTPVSAPDARGIPLHGLDVSASKSVSLLGYSDACSLSWALDANLASAAGLPAFKRRHENSLAEGVRSMTLAGLGVAWLPRRLVEPDLAAGRLVPASTRQLDIFMEVTIARRIGQLSDSAERLWDYLLSGNPGESTTANAACSTS